MQSVYGGRAQAGIGMRGFGGFRTLEDAPRGFFDGLLSLSLDRLRLATFASGGLVTLGEEVRVFFDWFPS